VWEAAEEVELALNPSQDLLVRDEEFDVTGCPL
jgi:hypothetical protein